MGNEYQRRGEYGETYKSSNSRRAPERFVEYHHLHFVHVGWNLGWAKVGVVVPSDIVHLPDTEIVHRIKYDNPHYMISRISCAYTKRQTLKGEGTEIGPTC